MVPWFFGLQNHWRIEPAFAGNFHQIGLSRAGITLVHGVTHFVVSRCHNEVGAVFTDKRRTGWLADRHFDRTDALSGWRNRH